VGIVAAHPRNETSLGGLGRLPLGRHDAAVRGLLRAADVTIRVAGPALLHVVVVAILDLGPLPLVQPPAVEMTSVWMEEEEEEEESTAMGEEEEEEEGEEEGGQGRCQLWARFMKGRLSRLSLMALLCASRAFNAR